MATKETPSFETAVGVLRQFARKPRPAERCELCGVEVASQHPHLLPNFHMTDAQWDSLMIPINMAFFFRSSPEARVVAMYPSPAGATESLLSLESWNETVAANPELEHMESDVEALLVNRIGHSRGFTAAEYYLLPIDQCFKLVGIIRSQWRGFSGGTEVWQQIADFFADLRRDATVLGGAANA